MYAENQDLLSGDISRDGWMRKTDQAFQDKRWVNRINAETFSLLDRKPDSVITYTLVPHLDTSANSIHFKGNVRDKEQTQEFGPWTRSLLFEFSPVHPLSLLGLLFCGSSLPGSDESPSPARVSWSTNAVPYLSLESTTHGFVQKAVVVATQRIYDIPSGASPGRMKGSFLSSSDSNGLLKL
ncbi:hypothetical protein I204_07884 [Kwoniella mangroviensis CBS 8886]|nr:hypothetical protein I204_07884 [Kwoniella mangroviensis CBS 8886]